MDVEVTKKNVMHYYHNGWYYYHNAHHPAMTMAIIIIISVYLEVISIKVQQTRYSNK